MLFIHIFSSLTDQGRKTRIWW